MKHSPINPYLIIANETALDASLDAINSMPGTFQELTLGDGEKTKRYRYCKYGTYPQEVKDVGIIQQVVDRETAELLASNFRAYAGLDVFFKGVPVYEGHPDDPEWLAKNPGHRATAVARIKSIEPGEDGIYVEEVFNSAGVALLSGEAPSYSGHSPRWKCVPIPARPGHYRPALLVSDGLTNVPNIPDSKIALNAATQSSPDSLPDGGGQTENTNNMKLTPDALKALGFAPDATPDETAISAAIVKLLGDKQTAEADKVCAESTATAANTRADGLMRELTAVRNTAVELITTEAVESGRITVAEKPQWVTALNTDLPGESAKLRNKMPVINTRSQLPGNLGSRRDEGALAAPGAIEAMNTAVRAYATKNHLNITTQAGLDAAWQACKVAKPELFKRG